MLIARSEGALRELEQEINSAGGPTQAVAVACDVADRVALGDAAKKALEQFNGIDTWVNNAGVSVYGSIQEISEDDHRRIFETNFWGVVHGSKIAVEHLKTRGGCLINVGSTLSDRAIPIQGMYSASKHAVKGFTDALRMELEADELPISVTLIKPAAINTPYTRNAKNYMQDAPSNPPPVYAPELVAETILYAAENRVRDLFVGGGGKALAMGEKYTPRMMDKYMEAAIISQMHSGKPRHLTDALHTPSEMLQQDGDYDGMVRDSSLYTATVTNPKTSLAALLGVGALAAAVMLMPRHQNRQWHRRWW